MADVARHEIANANAGASSARSGSAIGRFRKRLVSRSIGRTAWVLALVFFVFVVLNLLSPLSALACWAFATLAMIWPAISNDSDLVLESERGATSNILPLAGDAERSVGTVADSTTDPIGWRTVVDALMDPVLLVDPAGYIVHLNPPSLDIFPRARVGQPLISIMRSPTLIDAVERMDASTVHRVVQIEDRVPIVRKWSAVVSALTSDAGEMQAATMVMLRDLTSEQQHAQLRSDFISHASHELRTPLASLKSMVETLQGPAYNDEAARDRFLAMMQTQATRMSRLISDLLLLSRAESRVHLPPTSPVVLSDIVAAAVDQLNPLAQTRDTEIKFTNMAPGTTILGDRDDLQHVFQNLIQNAIKYGAEKSVIDVAVENVGQPSSPRGRIKVSVTDQGDGISAEHLSRITERFYRVSVTASRNSGGTGLGLAIVKYIVNRHRGDLQITSDVGVGSTFAVTFDRANAAV